MVSIMKKNLIALFLLSLTACSYSPNAFKEMYNDLGSTISGELKDPIDLSPNQEAKVDNYANEMMKWHRRNKLPEYAQIFSQLASYVQNNNSSVPALQAMLKRLDDMPHFEQAKHLTPIMIDIAKTLNKSQVTQLAKSLNEQHQKTKYEIKTEKQATVISEEVNQLFTFIEVPLNDEQRKILKVEATKFHDLRWLELQSEKKSDDRLIALIKRLDAPQFDSQFSQLWNLQAGRLKGRALQQQQQNDHREAYLLKTLIMKFSTEKRNKLASQLTSISNTFSEMANE